jgi:hypothetical protein
MVTSSAVITILGMTIDFDVVSTYFPKIPTEFGSPGIPVVTGQNSLSHRARPLEILELISIYGMLGLQRKEATAMGT